MVYQIYYDSSTRKHCRPEWQAIDNSKRLTPFAEAEVMRRQIIQMSDPWHGVLSWKVNQKTSFVPSALDAMMQDSPADLIGFHRGQNARRNDIFAYGDRWYFELNNGQFFRLCAEIVEASGYDWTPTRALRMRQGRAACVIQANYVIARPALYQAFIDELLAPAMDAMLLPEFGPRLWRTAKDMRVRKDKYADINPEIKRQFSVWVRDIHGDHRPEYLPKDITYWPLHCFVTEELWSIWLHRKDLRLDFIC